MFLRCCNNVINKKLKIRYRYVSSVSTDMAFGILGEFL